MIALLNSAHVSAEIDFFQNPERHREAITNKEDGVNRQTKIAKVLFFIAPGCDRCPDEAARLEAELQRIGAKYRIEGIFVGDPPAFGKYLAGLRNYPFNFNIALDMDRTITRRHGVKSFPAAIVEMDGKTFIVRSASELAPRLK